MAERIFILCHFITCFATLISLIVGLTRKENTQIKNWRIANRICCGIMLICGIALEVFTLPVKPIPAVIKCLLGITTIFLIEKTYNYKLKGELDRKRVICLFSSYALTVICGLVLIFINFFIKS